LSSHDDDILDFDFEEGATRETQGQPRPGGDPRVPAGAGGGGPRRPQFRAPQGLTPLLRLIGLVAFAIVIVVLLVVWAQGCSSDKERNTYNGYMTKIGGVGSSSAKIGTDLGELLTTPGLKQAELETRLSGLIQREQQDVEGAEGFDVPGPLRPAHDHAVEALQFRVSGMQGLLATFKATKAADTKNATGAGEQLATQARRLDVSDIVWLDLFRKAAQATVQEKNLTSVTVPGSTFVENVELYTSRSMTAIWQRIHGASTGGTAAGVHGTGLESTKVLPAGTALSTGTETTIKVSTALAFEVSVKNTGENQEVRVQVTLTIPKGTTPIVKKQTIDLIDVGEIKTVTFKDFPAVPFGEKTTLQVSVKPVPGETNTVNNSAEYPVIFSLE
jgi:uncharacterized repeat protein (TIGR01451 family)